MTEDEVGNRLTDVLEIHFLEIPKLRRIDELKDAHDLIVEWLQFLDAKSEEVMEMLAEKNEGIEKAYQVLKRMSQDEAARMAYEAREAEIRDQLTREKVARDEGRERGRQEGIEEGIYTVTKNLKIAGVEAEIISQTTGLSIKEINQI